MIFHSFINKSFPNTFSGLGTVLLAVFIAMSKDSSLVAEIAIERQFMNDKRLLSKKPSTGYHKSTYRELSNPS